MTLTYGDLFPAFDILQGRKSATATEPFQVSGEAPGCAAYLRVLLVSSVRLHIHSRLLCPQSSGELLNKNNFWLSALFNIVFPYLTRAFTSPRCPVSWIKIVRLNRPQ